MTQMVFEQIPPSIRKPGSYFEFNTKLAVRTLALNTQHVLFVAAMDTSGVAGVPLMPYYVFSDQEAEVLFGKDTPAHLMARAALKANRYVRLSVMGYDTTLPDIELALATVFAGDYQIVVTDSQTQTNLTVLRDHLDAVSHPMEQRGCVGVTAWTGTLATGSTLTTSLNAGRISCAWLKNSSTDFKLIAAAYAAVMASEEDPARPLNHLELLGVAANSVPDRAGRTEQEVAMTKGLTPLEVGPGDKVQIVRALSTYTKNVAGADDVSLLDITSIRTLDYTRKACKTRVDLRFPRDKKTKRVKGAVRSEILDVLVKLEELEILENVEENKELLEVGDDLQDVNRANCAIPADIVNGLHVIAGRIDMFL